MALPTGSFHYSSGGLLRLFLSANIYNGRYDTTGADPSKEGDIMLRAYCGPAGALNYSYEISVRERSMFFELDYPGGDVVWLAGIEEVRHTVPTYPYYVRADNPRLSWELIKK